jgi:uncharacterized membrane protein YhaH (DUF805 family)
MKNKKSNWDTLLTGANGRISSKRVFGGFILLVLLVVIVICVFTRPELVWLGEAFITMMIGSFALLGIGVFEKRFKNAIPTDPNESETIEGDEDADNCT